MTDFIDEEMSGGVTIEAPREAEPQEDPLGPTPDAPYGRFKNGKPRKAPTGSKPGRGGGKRGPAAPRPRAAGTAPKRSTAQPDFRGVVQEAISLASIPLMGMGRVNRAFLADAAALQMAAEPLGHAVNEVAKINPGVARLLSTTAPAVPYVLLGSALFNLGAQLMANHGKQIPIPGAAIADPEDLAQGIENQMVEAIRQQQEAEEQERRDYEWAQAQGVATGTAAA